MKKLFTTFFATVFVAIAVFGSDTAELMNLQFSPLTLSVKTLVNNWLVIAAVLFSTISLIHFFSTKEAGKRHAGLCMFSLFLTVLSVVVFITQPSNDLFFKIGLGIWFITSAITAFVRTKFVTENWENSTEILGDSDDNDDWNKRLDDITKGNIPPSNHGNAKIPAGTRTVLEYMGVTTHKNGARVISSAKPEMVS